MLWAYHLAPVPPILPVPLDPEFPEIVLRGMTTLVPGLAAVPGAAAQELRGRRLLHQDARESPADRPAAGEGAYIFAALSGYGLMAACAGGELLAAHMTGAALPAYAPAFLLSRYDDADYQQQLAVWGSTGQL
jgi:sarcosine oxidase subunit beta